MPNSVGSLALATRRTSDSVRIRCLIRSAMVIISRPCYRANFVSSGTRAMVPSSFMISQMTPAGYRPAIRARSTAASVWPARTSTPPGCARSGCTCPGRAKSPERDRGSMAASTVAALSYAEIPVVVRPMTSIGVQKAVSNRDVLSRTSSGICSSSSRSAVIERQINPRPYRARKLIASGVTLSAAIVRSPSFSRSSSSTMMRIFPARNASPASSMRANGLVWRAPLAILIGVFFLFIALMRHLSRSYSRQRQSRQFCGADDVLPDDVHFEIHAVAELGTAQIRIRHREGNDLHVEPVDAKTRNRQADAIYRNGALVYEKGREVRGKTHGEPVKIGVGPQLLDVADRVDVPLDEVAAHPAVRAQRAFEVHEAASGDRAERRHAQRLRPDVGVNLPLVREDDREAHAIHRDAVAR